jgi:hypothetical protein
MTGSGFRSSGFRVLPVGFGVLGSAAPKFRFLNPEPDKENPELLNPEP